MVSILQEDAPLSFFSVEAGVYGLMGCKSFMDVMDVMDFCAHSTAANSSHSGRRVRHPHAVLLLSAV